jgi:uncharacterized protein YbcI
VPEPEDRPGAAEGSEHTRASSPLLEISNATVRLYKDTFGRGPTQARARFAGPDTLVVLLRDTMTVAERKLAELGEHEQIRTHRLRLHGALEDEIREVVGQILGRPAVGVISGIDTRHDVAAEVIMLEPAPHPDPPPPA